MTQLSEMDPAEYEDDEAYCTEFQTDGERRDDGKLLWDFICPKCGHENTMAGDPAKFGKPFRCTGCGWVSILMTQALEELDEKAEKQEDT